MPTEKYIERKNPEIEDRMTFASLCVESVAKALNLPPEVIYRRMKAVNLINGYVLKHYEALHSESRENVTEDIIQCLNNWENLQKNN